VELKDAASLYTTTNNVHKSSCIENYYQTGLQETRLNMLLELFSQIINESCYNQLRTQEQLGYIVFSGVRRSNGAQGFRVIVQSERHPDYLDSRIEAFLGGIEETLEGMEETEFASHVEALATKRLEKPKKLSVSNGRYWSEILSQHYNFDRDTVEVATLRALTKADIVQFYRQHVADSPARRKLSCHVLSTCEGGAGHPATKVEAAPAGQVEAAPEPTAPPRMVSDITAFKASLPLFPLPRPFTHPDQLCRTQQPSEG
jgi:insulysin